MTLRAWWAAVGRFGKWTHPVGYCNNQMCCWGPRGKKVKWPSKIIVR